jgi:hypothetical protein
VGPNQKRTLGPNEVDIATLTARCSPASGCVEPATVARRPLRGGPWSTVATVRSQLPLDPTDLIATQAGVAALLAGTDVLTTSDGGLSVTRYPTPCTSEGVAYATSVAVTSAHGLALLCTGQGYMGHTDKRVYVSSDGGARWTRAGTPGNAGDGGVLAAATPSQLTIATASAASWLYYSGDAAGRWQTVHTEGDGGAGWADLGFTTAADGVVVHGPAFSDGNRDGRPGQLMLSSDGGAAWQLVPF